MSITSQVNSQIESEPDDARSYSSSCKHRRRQRAFDEASLRKLRRHRQRLIDEAETYLLLAVRLGFVDKKAISTLLDLVARISKMLTALRNSLLK
jgi:hypothetical protein